MSAPSAGPPEIERLRRMIALLRHRGPDGYGVYRDLSAALGHTRLSIIDLSVGAQPIHNEDQNLWVTFNGEIFNYLELRAELEKFGHTFYTRSDTEVIVHAYEQWGDAAWLRFNGQFAFGLWDRGARRLCLVRDPQGILPLHYYFDGSRVFFASEAKAIFPAAEIAADFSAEGLAATFTRWAAAAPATIFDRIRSVPPGSQASFSIRGGELVEQVESYQPIDLAQDESVSSLDPGAAADLLGERLSRAVDLRLRADVPVGAYLSGGVDSSLIAASIRRIHGGRLETFSVRFTDPRFDETAEQRLMVEVLGTRHHEIVCGPNEIRNALEDVIWHVETPLLRTAPVPMFLLSALVRNSEMKVVLTGEGADEYWAGYDLFKEDAVRRFWAKNPDSAGRPKLLSRIHPYVAGAGGGGLFWQEFFRRGLQDTSDPFYSHRIRWKNTAWSLRFLAPEIRAAAEENLAEKALEERLGADWRAWSPLARAQGVEIASFMMPYLLSSQGDRVAMAHGVEVRYPFLDPDVVRLAAQLPSGVKLRGLADKIALRRLAERLVPKEIARRGKRPYRAPIAEVIFGAAGRDYAEALLSPANLRENGLVDAAASRGLIDKATAAPERLSEREEMALIGLLTLQIARRQFGAEFAERARRAAAELRAPADVFVDQTTEVRR